MTNLELTLEMGRQVIVPQSLLKGQTSLKKFENGEICVKLLGVVFVWKNQKDKITMFLFQVCDVEKYANSQYTNLLVRIHNCKRNIEGDKTEIRITIGWHMEIRRVLHQATNLLMN
ncbi:unnamed protein product [Lactuca saligna]|uniref:Uncharacterized protein n=1 Tax=Lactuca saligna TaxID=75948 RepID=A0AA35Z789_LACSI|nr:unnamed protein product [Lactuca saligna]